MSHIRVQHTRHHHSRAFTLIELLVVISIIGLLSSVVMAAVNSARQKGTVGAGQKFDQYTHTAFYDDLVVSWNFDNDGSNRVIDLSGNGNDLAYYGAGGPSSTESPFTNGKSFANGGGVVARTGVYASGPSILNADLKSPPTGDFSVSFWLYPVTTLATDYIYSHNSLSPTTDKSWRFSYSSGGPGFVFNYYWSGLQTAAAGPLALNTWHHITAICNAGKIGIYVNGKATGTTDTVAASCGFLASRPLEISGAQPYYMDNVRIYKKALPLSFIREQYLAEAEEFRRLAQDLPQP